MEIIETQTLEGHQIQIHEQVAEKMDFRPQAILQQTTSARNAENTEYQSLRHAYPTMAMFAEAYNTELQNKANNPQHVDTFLTTKKAPKIALLVGVYGRDATRTWMMSQLYQVFYLTKSDPDAISQINSICDVCIERFWRCKASEWILFCAMCYTRQYKVSYGCVKTDAMLEAADKFLETLPLRRREAKDRLKKELEEKLKNYVRYDTWRYITLKSRLRLAWNQVHERLEAAGVIGLAYSLADNDSYSVEIQILTNLGILVTDSFENICFSEERYEVCLGRLKD